MMMRDESGMVMMTVIAFIIIMSVVIAGLFARNMSAAALAERESQAVKARVLAQGGYARAYEALRTGAALPAAETVSIDGRNYTVTVSGGTGSVSGADTLLVEVSY